MQGLGKHKQTNQMKNKPLLKYMLYTLKLWICKQTSRINDEPISEKMLLRCLIIGKKGQTNHLDEKQYNFSKNAAILCMIIGNE